MVVVYGIVPDWTIEKYNQISKTFAFRLKPEVIGNACGLKATKKA